MQINCAVTAQLISTFVFLGLYKLVCDRLKTADLYYYCFVDRDQIKDVKKKVYEAVKPPDGSELMDKFKRLKEERKKEKERKKKEEKQKEQEEQAKRQKKSGQQHGQKKSQKKKK